MKIYTNHVPHNCDFLTNGWQYEFTADDDTLGSGTIIDDDGEEIYIITERSSMTCAFLNDLSAWKFVK